MTGRKWVRRQASNLQGCEGVISWGCAAVAALVLDLRAAPAGASCWFAFCCIFSVVRPFGILSAIQVLDRMCFLVGFNHAATIGDAMFGSEHRLGGEMPFSAPVDSNWLLMAIRRFRHRRAEAYVVALSAVAVSTALRLAFEGPLPTILPFTTFSLAILIATVAGGLWPGLIALLTSAIAAWYYFLEPTFSFALEPRGAWALVMFILVGGANVALTSTLIASILRYDQRQQFLFRELQHRSQNLFAVLRVIASRSLLEARTVSDAKVILDGRLGALAEAHRVLAFNAWTGALLRQLLTNELGCFGEQVTMTGCDIVLNTSAAQHFCMLVHELTTNALKYGALSLPEGRIEIEGRLEQNDHFKFTWTECGGPRVTPPTRKGFGSAVLLEAGKVFGCAAATYRPEGLIYEFGAPLKKIAAASAYGS
jgi:two-component sensor histidine kinase